MYKYIIYSFYFKPIFFSGICTEPKRSVWTINFKKCFNNTILNKAKYGYGSSDQWFNRYKTLINRSVDQLAMFIRLKVEFKLNKCQIISYKNVEHYVSWTICLLILICLMNIYVRRTVCRLKRMSVEQYVRSTVCLLNKYVRWTISPLNSMSVEHISTLNSMSVEHICPLNSMSVENISPLNSMSVE